MAQLERKPTDSTLGGDAQPRLTRRELLGKVSKVGAGALILSTGLSIVDALTPEAAAAATTYGLRFVAELNAPDGTQVKPWQTFAKGWRVQYTGNVYAQRLPLVRIAGNWGPSVLHPQDMRPGETVDFWFDFRAPAMPQRTRATYQMRDPQGRPFGTQLWVEIVVTDGPPGQPSGDRRLARAAEWARGQVGSYAWGPHRNGVTECQRFVENAYGTYGRYPSAKAAGELAQGGSLPNVPGVIVFFHANSSNWNYGHSAIYLGNDRMVGVGSSGVRESSVSDWSRRIAPYRGWANPPASWPGR